MTPIDRDFFLALSAASRQAIAAITPDALSLINKQVDGFDPVTAADKAAETAIRAILDQARPDDGIWGEEFGWSRQEAPSYWSLDPIDGTRAFICGLPSWTSLVAYVDNGHVTASMIDCPSLDQCWIGIDGQTTRYHAGSANRCTVSGCNSIGKARLSTTDPYLFSGADVTAFDHVRRASRVCRFGYDALAYAKLADGDIDLVIENQLKPHDYQALEAVVRYAGGVIGNWSGGSDLQSGYVVAAASQQLYDQAVALLRS